MFLVLNSEFYNHNVHFFQIVRLVVICISLHVAIGSHNLNFTQDYPIETDTFPYTTLYEYCEKLIQFYKHKRYDTNGKFKNGNTKIFTIR